MEEKELITKEQMMELFKERWLLIELKKRMIFL